ncbi:hypothetical protein TNCV_4189291 [Trichonephila clavipes]|nr:hypothetical protein TNCV_4189291 [Trichonephila clavipes]
MQRSQLKVGHSLSAVAEGSWSRTRSRRCRVTGLKSNFIEDPLCICYYNSASAAWGHSKLPLSRKSSHEVDGQEVGGF